MNDVAVELIGDCQAMVDLREDVALCARASMSVLITGERGVGHERIARRIHDGSTRAAHTFAAVNCAGIPETLLESELFGHLKNGWAGAYRDRQGTLEAADHGTLLLGEINALSRRLQGRLLRFLQTGSVRRIGACGTHRADVRIISATTRNVLDLVKQGVFLEDLFYRLNIVHLMVPPLSQRSEDIPAIVLHLLSRRFQSNVRPTLRISDGAMVALATYSWPRNVQELEHAVEQLVVNAPEYTVGVTHLPSEVVGVTTRSHP